MTLPLFHPAFPTLSLFLRNVKANAVSVGDRPRIQSILVDIAIVAVVVGRRSSTVSRYTNAQNTKHTQRNYYIQTPRVLFHHEATQGSHHVTARTKEIARRADPPPL